MNVLVAHPSPEVRRELRTPLEAFGYGVIEVADPNEALERCRAVRPADPVAFNTAVILVVRHGIALQKVQEQLHRGAQDVLLEPVMPVEVLARVRSAARTKGLQEELVGQTRRLETMLHQDPLTGLFNRRYVLARLASMISGARRHGRPLSISMIDVDHFKRVNDAHGHEAGDKALVEVALSLPRRG